MRDPFRLIAIALVAGCSASSAAAPATESVAASSRGSTERSGVDGGGPGGRRGDGAARDARDAGTGEFEAGGDATGEGGDGDADLPFYVLPPPWSGSAYRTIELGNQAVSLGADGSDVYWQGAGGSLFACSVAGCGGAQPSLLSSLIGTSRGGLETLSVSNGVAAFVTDEGFAITTLAYADPGDASTAFTTPNQGSRVNAVITDATRLYFTGTLTTDAGYPDTMLASCPLTGSCPTPTILFDGATANLDYPPYLGAIFVADGEVYFSEVADVPTINAVSVHGGAARTVCGMVDGGVSLYGILSLVVAGGYAYFTTEEYDAMGSIYECPTSGGEPVRYLRDYAPYALATDGQNLYWTNYVPSSGTVATCALGATCTSPFTVASNQDSPYAITANSSTVFWSTVSAIFAADR